MQFPCRTRWDRLLRSQYPQMSLRSEQLPKRDVFSAKLDSWRGLWAIPISIYELKIPLFARAPADIFPPLHG